MSVVPVGVFLILVVYILVAVVIGVLIYLSVRFAIRDGLRGHQLWLERTDRGSGSDPHSE